MERIQKMLASSGIASRRKCEELIRDGRVKKNGKFAVLGEKADADDVITVDDVRIRLEPKTYILINKPKGILSSVSDARGKTVVQLVTSKMRLFPVGRLDKDAEGLMLLTNDGELANRIMHPRYETIKEYEVVTNRMITNQAIRRINDGVMIDGRRISARASSRDNYAKITVHEGQKHLVKRIFNELGYEVQSLKRTRLATMVLDLEPGRWRYLTKDELKELKAGLKK